MITTWIHLYVPGEPNYVFSTPVPSGPGNICPREKECSKNGTREKPKVLVVDDERVIADSLAAILNRSGFEAVAKYDGMSAIDSIREECPDIVLSDVIMPELNGVQVAKAVRSSCPSTRIVLISGNASTPNLIEQALPGGHSFELLAKPIHPSQLLKILKG